MATQRKKPLVQLLFWIIIVLVLSQLQLRSLEHSSNDKDDLLQKQQQQLTSSSSSSSSRISAADFYDGSATASLSSSQQQQQPFQHQSNHVRLFMGIFTKVHQRGMREVVRKALGVYNDTRLCEFGNRAAVAVDGPKITSLLLPPPPPDHCQLMYTFVIGSNTNNNNNNNNLSQIVKIQPTSSRRRSKDTTTLLVAKPDSRYNTTLEPRNDVTFLNIQENNHEGKTNTWFYYASQVMHAYDWDYAIKSDVRTGLRLDIFLEYVNQHQQDNFPRGGRRIYSGRLDWATTRGTPYMLGQLYILSRDLADRVAMEPVPNAKDIPRLEDKDMGQIIMKLNLFTHLITFGDWTVDPSQRPWVYPLSGSAAFEQFARNETRRLAEKKKKKEKKKMKMNQELEQ